MDFPQTNNLNRIEKVCNWEIREGGTYCDTVRSERGEWTEGYGVEITGVGKALFQ